MWKANGWTDGHLPMDITFLHNVVSSTPPLSRIRTNNFSGDRHPVLIHFSQPGGYILPPLYEEEADHNYVFGRFTKGPSWL
jgi:hypothetical protein